LSVVRERIIKIGQYLAMMDKSLVARFLDHGVDCFTAAL